MIYIIAFQVTVFVAYIAYIWTKYGVLDSISESYYVLPNPIKHLFTFFLWTIAVPMMFIVNSVDHADWWLFGSCACLVFCGAAAEYKNNLTNVVHFIGAGGGIIFALAGLVHQGIAAPLILMVATIVVLYKYKVSNKTWWIEIAAFVYIEAGLTWTAISI